MRRGHRMPDPWTESLRALELAPDAGWEAIQARYRRLVLAWHPDVNRALGAATRFRRIAAAYQRLAALRSERLIRRPESVARLCEDPRVRRLSADEMGMRLRHSSSPQVRAAAAHRLSRIGGPDGRRHLLAAWADRDPMVRREVLKSLGEAGKPGDLLRFTPMPLWSERDLIRVWARSALRIWSRALAACCARVGRLKGRDASLAALEGEG